MMRGGFTFTELLLAGVILATISFGALIGITRLSGFIDRRGEVMAADGYCWDVAWKLFNEEMSGDNLALQALVDEAEAKGLNYYEIEGEVLPAAEWAAKRGIAIDKSCDFLAHLQYPGSPPICYVTLSNRHDRATGGWDKSGVFIGVNLEWGSKGFRRILRRRAGNSAETCFGDQQIEVFRSVLPRTLEE